MANTQIVEIFDMVSGHLVYNFDRWIWPALLLRQNWLRWLQFVNGRLKFWRHLTKFYEKCRTNSKRFRNNLSSDVVCNRIFVFRVKNLMGHNSRMSITEYGQCYCRSVCFFYEYLLTVHYENDSFTTFRLFICHFVLI